MSDTTAETKGARRRGDWRHRETRAASKYIAKRVTEEDHLALTKYADDLGVKVSELMTPFVRDLIQRAHEHCGQPRHTRRQSRPPKLPVTWRSPSPVRLRATRLMPPVPTR